MDADANVRVVLAVFAAIEQRDTARFLAPTHPQVSICWPPSLPWNDGLPGRPGQGRAPCPVLAGGVGAVAAHRGRAADAP
jgi:hypothetical protein